MDSNEGSPGLVPHCDRYNPLVLNLPDTPPTPETVPGAEDKHMIAKEERVGRGVGAQESARGARREEGAHQPMRREPSTEIPDSPPPAFQLPPSFSSFGQHCSPSQAPTVEPGRLDHLSYGQLRNLRKQHGCHREDAKDVLNTRFASMQDQPAIGSTQNFPVDVAKPSASAVKRGRPPADVAEHLQGPTLAPGKRCRIRKNIGNTRAPGERPLW